MHAGELTAAERKVWSAFGSGRWVDLTGHPDPQVRAEVLNALLLRADPVPDDGRVPAVRIRGATLIGTLDLSFGTLVAPLQLDHCVLEHAPDLTGATARSVRMVGCTMPGFVGRLLEVSGDLLLSDARIEGCLMLEDATIGGGLNLNRAQLLHPGGRALSGGGMEIGGGLFGQHGLRAEGTVRLIGARISGGILLDGAQLECPGGVALCVDEITTTRLVCAAGFTARGEVQVRNAQISGEFTVDGAHLDAAGHPFGIALRARGLVAADLVLRPASVHGLVNLSRARIGAVRDDVDTWPTWMRLDGMTYDHLLARGRPVGVRERCRWLDRDAGVYRPQPYEQLAAYYRRLGHDDDARRVLLAKQRRRRRTLGRPARVLGYLLDGLVGYGYRPWLAAAWLVVLLVVGTAVFTRYPPHALDPAHQPHFDAFIYVLDLVIPIGAFGLRAAFVPTGDTRWLAYTLIAAGWVLATALIAGISRTLRRD